MWTWLSKLRREVFGFFAAEVSSCADVFPRPSLGAERGKELDDDCDTFVLDADEDVREEEMQSSSRRERRLSLIQDSRTGENEKNMKQLTR